MRILAISPAHDSSVCVLNDGELEFFCKEERITGIKKDNYPIKSLNLAMDNVKGPVDEFIWAIPSNSGPGITEMKIKNSFADDHFKVELRKRIGYNCTYREINHHLSHAMLAFVNSKFEEAIVVVIDHDGSIFYIGNEHVARECETIFLFNKEMGEKVIHKSFWMMKPFEYKSTVRRHLQDLYPDSYINVNNELGIVKVYEAATTLIGQNPLENGKTMGLSSYGENVPHEPLFINDIPNPNMFETVDFKDKIICFNNMSQFITKDINKENYQPYANKAKQVQLQTQEVALNLIRKYVESTGIKNVCLVGGYALNVVANNFYLKNLPDVNFYFEPTADDTGISIGACMALYYKETNEWANPLNTNFYQYYNNSEQIPDEIKSKSEKASLQKVVKLLMDGKSIAIFEGNPEAGPRALGHRSILFDARNPNAKEIVNEIKRREWYRPFAGVILKEEFEKYFETEGIINSPYMTINFDAKEKTKELVPGIIHVDGTCRIQTVEEGTLFEILKLFHKKTKCPMLLNTSFNLAGKPLVQTKRDAMLTFENSSLDALYFVDENIIFTK